MSDDLSELDSFNEKLNKTTATEAYPAPPQALTIASEETEENSPTKSKDASMWAVQGTNYFPCDESVKELASAQYEVCYSPNSGYFFRQTSVKTDELIKLPDSASEEVIQNIENFWTKEAHFRSFGFLWKRGILLWGPAGSGKTCTIQLVAENIIKRGGIAVYVNDPTHTAHGLAVMRKIEPNRPIVVMMEDLDTLLQQHGEQSILALLDGELQVDNVCFIACHSPDTKILTKDLRWVPARDLKEGDELWGFDEHRSDAPEGISPSAYRRQSARRFKTATVVSSFTATKECVRVHLDTGESFVCTTDHPWLSYGAKGRGGKNLEWELAENLLERPNLVRPFLPWEEDTSKDAGWLAGMLDGEGNVYFNRDNGACGIAVCQRLGKTADKLVEIANKFGKFKATVLIPKVEQHSDQIRLRNTGGTAEAAAILGKVRPERLIDNFDLTGKIVQRNFEARVVHIEHIGKQEVQSLETTSKTYFAEGFAVHNTTNYPERLDKRLVNRPSRFDIVKLVAMPNAEARRLFLSKKARNLKDNPAELDKWVKGTEGFSIAHLKELIISVEIFEADVEYAIKRLRKMIDTSPKSTDALRSPGQYN